MKVIRAGVLGFCTGVRRAVEMALRESSENLAAEPSSVRRVYTLGPLIHNPRVLEDLKNRGVLVLDEGEIPADMKDSTVIIRAHGVSPETERMLVRSKARVIDATCPHVKANQKKAAFFAERGYIIFLAGEENHAEITGIRGYAEEAENAANALSSCVVVANPGEAETAAAELSQGNRGAKAVLVGQTTISPDEYEAIGEKIKRYFPALEIVNTICAATRDRQDALRELDSVADAFVIAGGSESANARRLLSIARSTGKKAWLVDSAVDIPDEIFSFSVAGLCAGASTPDETIDEIERILERGC